MKLRGADVGAVSELARTLPCPANGAEAAPAGPSRVLYVDDEPTLCRAFSRLFAAERDLSIVTTSDPLEAAAWLGDEPFDVIVSDLRMPGLDGIALLAQARRARPEVRRLLVSGYADLDSALTAINEVAVDRLFTKPWNSQELVKAVRTAAEHRRLVSENARITEALRLQAEQLATMNRRLDGLVEERTRDLLSALVSALDLRDAETQWHSRRVGLYARRLAAELGVGGRDLDDIERGAILHDIGKIGVRDAVLLKRGPLDEQEWAEMRRHPVLGHDILKGIGFLDNARLIPLHHQERWDGSGYPAGLKGEEICLGARVFAVVDTYDAITSNRPYRQAQPYEFARAEIERCAGRQFDPAVVAAWAQVPPEEWTEIRRRLEATAR